jgi:D-arabinose 1-dehydrogenase-like Zn-dependent alcohol dehydrogenase
MAKMRVAQIARANGPIEIVDRDIPSPGAGEVRLKVQACGICHSDSMVKEGLYPGLQYPRVPGHEVAGVIDAVGAGVVRWKVGDRGGVGWHGGSCGYCDSCRRGDFFACETWGRVTGITRDGGYSEYMVAPADTVAAIPAELTPIEAAPLMCAGVTTFNALRNSGARGGDTVAILGLGGLGHLGVQFAAKMGFRTVAIARGADKAPLAKQLGAHHYIDNAKSDPGAELAKLGGAKAILATVTESSAMAATIGGLATKGTLMVIGAVGPMTFDPLMILMKDQSIKGWYSGTSLDSQETLAFSVLTGVRSMSEVMPLSRVSEGYDRMMSGNARFRVILDMAK